MAMAQGLALLVGVLLTAVSAAATAPLNQPAWTAGDFWTYDTSTVLTPGLNLTGTVTTTVQGELVTTVGGISLEAYRLILQGSGTAAGEVQLPSGNVTIQGSWVLTGEERFEHTDLTLVYNLLDLSVNGTYQNVLPFSLRVQNTTTFQTRADTWRYPLSPGSSGSQTVAFNFTQDFYSPSSTAHTNGTGEWTFGFSMAPPTTETVPAGTFEAYAITQTWPDGSSQRSYASAEVGNAVRTESYAPDGNRTAVTELTAYRYQALETPTFLGLTSVGWAVVIAAIAAVVVVLVWRWRVRRASPPRQRPPPSGPT